MDKQKITLEVKDISTLLDGLNNAMIAYDDIIWAIYLCCKIPSKLEPLKSLPFEQLRERLKALKDVYEQLLKIEKGEQS